MSLRQFSFYNIVSAILWIGSLLGAGYFFGRFPIIKDNFSIVIYGIIALSFLPPVFAFIYRKSSCQLHNLLTSMQSCWNLPVKIRYLVSIWTNLASFMQNACLQCKTYSINTEEPTVTMDMRKIKKLIELIQSTGVAEIEIREGEESVRITREVNSSANDDGARHAPCQLPPASSTATSRYQQQAIQRNQLNHAIPCRQTYY